MSTKINMSLSRLSKCLQRNNLCNLSFIVTSISDLEVENQNAQLEICRGCSVMATKYEYTDKSTFRFFLLGNVPNFL